MNVNFSTRNVQGHFTPPLSDNPDIRNISFKFAQCHKDSPEYYLYMLKTLGEKSLELIPLAIQKEILELPETNQTYFLEKLQPILKCNIETLTQNIEHFDSLFAAKGSTEGIPLLILKELEEYYKQKVQNIDNQLHKLGTTNHTSPISIEQLQQLRDTYQVRLAQVEGALSIINLQIDSFLRELSSQKMADFIPVEMRKIITDQLQLDLCHTNYQLHQLDLPLLGVDNPEHERLWKNIHHIEKQLKKLEYSKLFASQQVSPGMIKRIKIIEKATYHPSIGYQKSNAIISIKLKNGRTVTTSCSDAVLSELFNLCPHAITKKMANSHRFHTGPFEKKPLININTVLSKMFFNTESPLSD